MNSQIDIRYAGREFKYQVLGGHLNNRNGSNRAILNVVLGSPRGQCTEAVVRNFLREVYGYEPGGGDWLTWRDSDSDAANRVLEALAARGCVITTATR